MRAGACEVTAVDVDPYAIAVAQMNAALNSVAIATLQRDMLGDALPNADIILVGDLFYDWDLAQRVTAFLDRCLAVNIDVLVGDPGRPTLPRERLQLLAEYPGVDFGDAVVLDNRNGVFAFIAAPA